MRTEIIIPDPIFEASEQLAQKLGITLGDLYVAALSAYISDQKNDTIVEALNRIYETKSSTLDSILGQVQAASIGKEAW